MVHESTSTLRDTSKWQGTTDLNVSENAVVCRLRPPAVFLQDQEAEHCQVAVQHDHLVVRWQENRGREMFLYRIVMYLIIDDQQPVVARTIAMIDC